MDIGARIRTARKAAGLTQEDVARRGGLTLKAVGEVERGEVKDPHFSSLVKIAHALGVPVGELLEEEPVPLGEVPQETGPVHEREIPYMDRPEVREWLDRNGHKSAEEFRADLEGLELDLDPEGHPRALVRAIVELRAQRDRLTEELRKLTVQRELFPPRQGLPTREERIKEALRPAGEAFKLRSEIRYEYLTRELDVVGYGRHYLGIYASRADFEAALDLEAALEELERDVLVEAGVA